MRSAASRASPCWRCCGCRAGATALIGRRRLRWRIPGAPFAALWRDRTSRGLTLALSILWFVLNGLHQFEPLFLNQLGAGETIIGLASTIGAVVELPAVPVILFSHAVNGVAYSFFAVASVLFISEVAPQRQVTTMMAIFTVTLPALIRMISGPVSGRVLDARGAYALYVIAVIGLAAGWLIMKVMVKDRRMEG